jgi:hypothetical protein
MEIQRRIHPLDIPFLSVSHTRFSSACKNGTRVAVMSSFQPQSQGRYRLSDPLDKNCWDHHPNRSFFIVAIELESQQLSCSHRLDLTSLPSPDTPALSFPILLIPLALSSFPSASAGQCQLCPGSALSRGASGPGRRPGRILGPLLGFQSVPHTIAHEPQTDPVQLHPFHLPRLLKRRQISLCTPKVPILD